MLLRVDKVTKSFDGFVAVQDVELLRLRVGLDPQPRGGLVDLGEREDGHVAVGEEGLGVGGRGALRGRRRPRRPGARRGGSGWRRDRRGRT